MLHDLALAIGYFTRIPMPAHPNFTERALRRSAVFFPLVGAIVGAMLTAIYFLLSVVFSTEVSVLITLTAGFFLTGGFHEDGWADTFDGLGGAFTREKKLAIMSDSRIGTYGTLALWSLLSLKAFALFELLPKAGAGAWLMMHCISRWAAMAPMVFLPYVKTGPTKAKPVVQTMSAWRWALAATPAALCIGLLPELWLATAAALLFIIPCGLVFLHRQLGGYTGDTLGAMQQASELLLVLAWIWYL